MIRFRGITVGRGGLAAVAAATLLAVTGCGSDDSSSDASNAKASSSPEITLAAFGGSYGKAEKKAYVDPYADETGNKVKMIEAEASLAQIELQVKNQKVQWDVTELAAPDAERGCRGGTLEKLNLPDDALAKTQDGATFECGIAASIYTEGIGYDPEKVSGTPTWEDFFDTGKYPGRRAMETYILDGTLEHALRGDGVAADQLYPLDVDRALKKIDGLGDDLVLVDSLAQASQLLSSGSVAMTQTASGRILDLQRSGAKVAFSPVGQRGVSVFVIPKGAKNADAAREFLTYLATCESCSTTMADETAYAGPNAAGNQQASAEVKPLLPSAPEVVKVSFAQDVSWWADNAADAFKKFEAFTAGK